MIILFLITSIYLILILSFVYGFNKIKNFESDASSSNEKFSVIIPFRNEGQNGFSRISNHILELEKLDGDSGKHYKTQTCMSDILNVLVPTTRILCSSSNLQILMTVSQNLCTCHAN